MSPDTTYIPVFFQTNISDEVVDDFFSKACATAEQTSRRYEFRIIGDDDDADTTKGPSGIPIGGFTPRVFSKRGPREMIEALDVYPNVTDEAFVILDRHTEQKRTTCRLVWRYHEHFHSARSQFRPSLVALVALLDSKTTIQQLQNDAASAGGALTDFADPSDHGASSLSPEKENLLKLCQRRQEWTPYCTLRATPQETVILPVFCTAEVSLGVINEFISSIGYNFYDSYTDNPYFTFIFSPSITFPVVSTTSPLSSPPSFPFLGFPASALATFVRQNFPGTGLHHTHFVILDSHTADAFTAGHGIEGQSCIVADMSGTYTEEKCANALQSKGMGEGWRKEEGGLVLARVPLHAAFSTCLALNRGDLDIDVIADEAASRYEGVQWELGDI